MAVLQRVDRLEDLMAELTYNVTQLSRDARINDQRSRRAEEDLREHLADISNELRTNINNLSIEMRYSEEKGRKADEALRKHLNQLSQDLRASEEKAKAADEALGKYIAETSRELRDNMNQLSQEMQEFKDEVREENRQLSQHLAKMSDEMRRSRRNLNKKVAEISNKMGTLAEDLVAPSIPSIFAKVVNVMSVCGDYVLICEVKSRLRPEDVRNFRDETLSKARLFWQEYASKKIIGALGTFYVEPSLIKHGERLGFIMLGVVDGLMNTLNQEGFVPTEF
jgi:chromosome segregation ATPase